METMEPMKSSSMSFMGFMVRLCNVRVRSELPRKKRGQPFTMEAMEPMKDNSMSFMTFMVQQH